MCVCCLWRCVIQLHSHQRSCIASIIIKVSLLFLPTSILSRRAALYTHGRRRRRRRRPFDTSHFPAAPSYYIIHVLLYLASFFWDSPSHKERGIVYRGSYRALNISSLCKVAGEKEEGGGGGALSTMRDIAFSRSAYYII